MKSAKQEALVGVGELETLASKYEASAKILRKVARSLRSLTEGFGRGQVRVESSESRKRPLKRKKMHSTAAPQPRKKGMSPAARKKLSQMMKVRWAEKRAMAHKPNGQHKKAPVGEALKGQVA